MIEIEQAKAVKAVKAVKVVPFKKTKNDYGWEALFDIYPILQEVNNKGYYDISAKAINLVRPARLMARAEKYSRLSYLFKLHNLSILAIKNGLYRITRENPFVFLPSLENKVKYPVKYKEGLVSLDTYKDDLSSETSVLNMAYYQGILDDCFGEHTHRTTDGRHSATFDFLLGNTVFEVESVQVEIDGAFEGTKCIHAVEVKMDVRTDVTLRQVLFPKKYLEQRYPNKEVCSWLLDYRPKSKKQEENIFNLYKFEENNGVYMFDEAQSKRYVFK